MQIASQSSLDCSEAQGLVNSIYFRIRLVYGQTHTNAGVTHIVNAKLIKGFGNLNLLLGIKKGIGKLFALTGSFALGLLVGAGADDTWRTILGTGFLVVVG